MSFVGFLSFIENCPLASKTSLFTVDEFTIVLQDKDRRDYPRIEELPSLIQTIVIRGVLSLTVYNP